MAQNNLQAPRGTRDFYPDELRLRNWLFGHFSETARSFGFEQVDAPVLEHAELFTRKAGEEIVEQLYHFVIHDRHLTLRPEITPQIARMVMARAGALRMPLRWFSLPQCWRYERMTRGRKREHYQWNMDIWGEPDVSAEAELIASIFHLLDRLGLGGDAVKIRVSSRSVLEETLRESVLRNRPEVFAALCIVIDKLDKIGADAVVDLLADPAGAVAIGKPEARAVVEMLEAGSLEDAARHAPQDSRAVADLRELFSLLDAYGIADRIVFDASVVRGLAYYTGIVFELFDRRGELRAICGGGRYDGLITALGGRETPGIGFATGMERLTLSLSRSEVPVPDEPSPRYLVADVGDDARIAALDLSVRLRRAGVGAILSSGSGGLRGQMRQANALHIPYALILGDDEIEKGEVVVRDMESSVQESKPLEEFFADAAKSHGNLY